MLRSLRFQLPALFLLGVVVAGFVSAAIALRLFRSYAQDRSRSRHLHALPDDELLQELKEYNGTPPEIIANRALMDLILPTLRADFMLAEVYTYRAAPRLAMPITVFSGRADPHISETQAQSWAKETSASCDVTFFDGDHFFINHERQAILESVSRELAEKERV